MYVSCKLHMCKIKYSKLGFLGIVQHSVKESHNSMSKDRFSNNVKCITDGFIQAVAVSDQLPTTSQRIVLFDPVVSERVAAAETK